MNNIERRVLELIGEDPTAPDIFLDTDAGLEPIRDSINDAIQEVVSMTGSRQNTYFIPLRESQVFYRVYPKDGHFGWVVDARLINRQNRLEQTDLSKLSTHDPRWMVSNGPPRSYVQVGLDVIGLYPKPGGDTDTLELKIVEIPKAYDRSVDRQFIRRDFEHAVVNYAVAEFWASRGDARSATDYMQQYLDALGMRETFDFRRDNAPRLETKKEPYPKETA